MKQYILATLLLGGSASSLTGCSGNVGTGDNAGDGSDSNGDGDDGGGGGPGGPPPVSACNGEASVGVGRWRRLTKAQYANSVRDLIGEAPDTSAFVADSRTGTFKTNSLLPLQDSDVDTYATLAESMSKKIAGNLAKIVNCNASTVGEDKCAAQFIKDFGSRAYRRPLTSAEEMDFTAVYAAGKAENRHLVGR